MRRSKSMLVVAVLGLALGISLALGGWSGLWGFVIPFGSRAPDYVVVL